MSTSTANVTPTNIPLSPMRVEYNGVDLGGTTNEVSMSIHYDMADIKVDQFGTSIIDKVVKGLAYSVKLVLAEVKNKDNWKVVFPSIHEVVVSGVKTIYSDMQIGDHMYPKAFPLLLHPLENADADLSEDYLFYKATATNVTEIKYGPEKQSGLQVEFIVYPDVGTVPARYMYHGNPANGLVPAAAGSPTPGSNTGNGTITNVSVFNGVTYTETITINVLDGGVTGNNIQVSGSVSGILGVAHIAAASTSTTGFIPASPTRQVIAFTITQGTVQFVAGDTFTIATTASNYS
jgi:hypothetical protein